MLFKFVYSHTRQMAFRMIGDLDIGSTRRAADCEVKRNFHAQRTFIWVFDKHCVLREPVVVVKN